MRARSNQGPPLISPADCEAIFFRYSKAPAAAAAPSPPHRSSSARSPTTTTTARDGQLLTFELFLAALVHAASRLQRPEVPFLSDGVREYLQNHLTRAERVAPTAARKGGGVKEAVGVSPRGSETATRKSSASGAASSSSPSNGRKASGTSARSKPPSVRRPSAEGGGGGGGKGGGNQDFSGFGSTSGAQASFGGPDSASSGIEHELSMLGLQSSSSGAGAIPIRRGGGFEMP